MQIAYYPLITATLNNLCLEENTPQPRLPRTNITQDTKRLTYK